nr:hypothetical protein [Mucilaginibacter sp. L294]
MYKISHDPENDADKYYQAYFNRLTALKIAPVDKYESKYSVRFTHYNTGFSIIGFKASSGSIYVFNFQDSISRKYFSLRLFDKSHQSTFSVDEVLVNKLILAYVNQDDLNNPLYGTKQNSIPVFSFKGITEPVRIISDNPGSVNGYKTLEPTQAEYEHNVLTYLKYIMPQKEFNARFKGK